MIYGIGTDICATARIEHIVQKKYGERFIKRVLTEQEIIAYESLSSSRQVEFLAGRFAVKEAISKALGTGIGEQFGFHDASILNDQSGKPIGMLSEACITRLQLNKEQLNLHISISHEKDYVVAYVIIEK